MSSYISWAEPSSSSNVVKVESGPELTLSPSFTSRQPNARVSPSPQTSSTSFVASDAISASQNNNTSTARHHVHSSVNPASASPVQRSYGHSKPSTLETIPVSSSSQPINNHGLTKPSSRLRTTIFQSSKDLAAHYGIPQFLPPAPRTTPKTTTATSPSSVQQGPSLQQNQYPDFDSIKNSYLAMLSSKPQEATPSSGAAAPTTTASPSTAPTAQHMPPPPAPAAAVNANDKELQDLLTIFESPEFKDSLQQFTPVLDESEMDAFLTSPLPSLGHDFDESPRETPYADFLSTPLFETIDPTHSVYSSPLFTDADDFSTMLNDPSAALFGYENAGMFNPQAKVPASSAAASMSFDMDALIPFTSPEHTMEDAFPSTLPTPSSLPHELPPSTATTSTPTEAPRRRPGATGTRKGITPDSLIPLDAPTQPRKYTTPSATSRKDLPAVFARKRSRSTAFPEDTGVADDDDELARHEASPPGPNATEREQIEWKRRQNTLAARKSRKRKLEHQQRLEEEVRELRRERDCWRTRAGVLQQLLVSHGVPFERWDEEE